MSFLEKLGKFGTALGGIGAGISAFRGGPSTSLHKKQLRLSQEQFDAQMDQTIQRRVKDAMAAGIHPLFAMGGGIGSSPTITSAAGPVVPRSGSSAGDAISRLGASLGNLPNAKAARELDEAQAAYYNALAAKAKGDVNAGPRTYPYGSRPGPGNEGWHDIVKPEVPASQSRGVQAGNMPESIRVTPAKGPALDIPNPELGLDEIGQFEYARKKSRNWLSTRFEDMAAAWSAVGSPSNAEVRRLQAQLEWIRNNPEKVREAERLYEKIRLKVRAAVRRLK